MRYLDLEGNNITEQGIRQKHPNISYPPNFDFTELGYLLDTSNVPPKAPEGFEVILNTDSGITNWQFVRSANWVPASVTPRQARIALLRANMLDAVNTAVSSNAEWAITWEFATEVKRDDPMIGAVQKLLGKTDLEIDQLFIDASKL